MSNNQSLLNKTVQDLPTLAEGENICLALSGGLDSTTLVHVLVSKYGADRVKALAFDFGQRHSIELDMAVKTACLLDIEFDVIKLDYLKDIAKETSALIEGSDLKPKTAEENAGDPQVNTYVSFRNLQFASITAAYAEANNCRYIAQGLNEVDEYSYWDTSSMFTKAVNDVLQLNRQNVIQFIAPFVSYHKVDELIIAKELSELFNYDILEHTWSCYNGSTKEHNFKECGLVGKCNTCMEKLTAYVLAGFTNVEIMERFDIESEQQLNEYRNLIQ